MLAIFVVLTLIVLAFFFHEQARLLLQYAVDIVQIARVVQVEGLRELLLAQIAD